MRHSPPLFALGFAALLSEQRRAVRQNLRRIRGRRPAIVEVVDVLRTFVQYGHCLAESLAVGRPEADGARVQVLGQRYLERALAGGKGAVLVTAHSGAWDAAAPLLGRDHGVDVMVVMAQERDRGARALHDRVRRQGGVTVQHVGEHPLDALALLRHLRRGGVVAVQLDRAGSPTTAEAQLFGTSFLVPRGPFHLAKISGAPIVPAFARRMGYFDYEVEVFAPYEVPRSADTRALDGFARRAVADMEHFVRKHPTQWFHFTKLREQR